MSALVCNLILALIWAIAMGPFTPTNFFVGFALGFVVLALVWRGGKRGETGYGRNVLQFIAFAVFFIKELIVANLRMAQYTLSPLKKMNPAILAVPLEEMSDLEIMTLANLLTLTPGTLSLDVSDDRRTLYVHFMHVDDPERSKRELKEGFERRLLEVMR